MRKRKIAIAVAIILLLTVGTVWARCGRRSNAQVEKVKQMQAELFKPGTQPDPTKLPSCARQRRTSARPSARKSEGAGASNSNDGSMKPWPPISPCLRIRRTPFLTSASKRWRNGEKRGKRIVVKEADPVAPAAPGEEHPPADRVDLEDRVAQAARADPVAVPAGRVVACRDSTVLRHLSGPSGRSSSPISTSAG